MANQEDVSLKTDQRWSFPLLKKLLIGMIILHVAFFISYAQKNDSSEVVLSEKLFEDVNIFCWVPTKPDNFKTKAKAVKETWAKRCNKFIFISKIEDLELEVVALPVEEGTKNLWNKTKAALIYIYQNYLNQYDWFLKADDDTFMIMENLRYLLYQYNPLSPIYLGNRLNSSLGEEFMSGGSGYVLSRNALSRFVEIGMLGGKYCKQKNDYPPEDMELSKCLKELNVTDIDSRDLNGRKRMFSLSPEKHLFKDESDSWHPEAVGRNCCSSRTISFHYISPAKMYAMEFLLYELKLFGLKREEDELPFKNYSVELYANESIKQQN
ncbi:C1GALT1.2 family protein [Megaselia abdita]